ncbi:MAG: arylesterase [Bryobacteraceae bacterium]
MALDLRRIAACLLAALALAAPAARAAEPAKIVTFGDSITEGYGVPLKDAYPARLADALASRGIRANIVNAGVSGDTSGNALDRLPQVIALAPSLVILEIGGNDGLRGLPTAATRRNIDLILGGLGKAGIRVVLVGMTLPANYGKVFVRQFEQIYEELAASHKVRLASLATAGIANAPGMMQRDGIHPTALGHRRLAEFLLPHVTALLRR